MNIYIYIYIYLKKPKKVTEVNLDWWPVHYHEPSQIISNIKKILRWW
jgi:hypothetical protein